MQIIRFKNVITLPYLMGYGFLKKKPYNNFFQIYPPPEHLNFNETLPPFSFLVPAKEAIEFMKTNKIM